MMYKGTVFWKLKQVIENLTAEESSRYRGLCLIRRF